MRRSGFKRPQIERAPYNPQPLPEHLRRPAVMARADAPASPVEKTQPVRHEGYRRLVASLPCKACGIVGYSQAAHPNTGKGAGSKTDDRLCFALCADRPGVRGCHSQFDQGALFSKAARRAIEQAWGADTRRQIDAMGQWPTTLPRMTETEIAV